MLKREGITKEECLDYESKIKRNKKRTKTKWEMSKKKRKVQYRKNEKLIKGKKWCVRMDTDMQNTVKRGR